MIRCNDFGKPARAGRACGAKRAAPAGSVLVLVFALSACGGGGGGGSSTPSAPPCIETADRGCLEIMEYNVAVDSSQAAFQSQANFRNQWGLGSIRAHRAYAHLALVRGASAAPGDGVTVGFVDSGIDRSHPLFEGATISEIFLQGAVDETGARSSHGTAVASVAAAPRIPRFTSAAHGVAWGADIAMFAVPTGRGPALYSPASPARLRARNTTWASIINGALNWQGGTGPVGFLNLSVGTQGIIDDYSEAELRANFGDAIGAMAQSGAREKTVLVWAAGNAHGHECSPGTDHCVNGSIDAASVEVYPGLVARIRELQGHTVSVVATGEDGRIAGFSNRCGLAADWCLAAPGEGIATAYFGPHEGRNGFRGGATVSGTSFAAPMVTGGLAVMKHLFRDQLSNSQLLARLLETANDRGIYADRATYGHGLMDLGAAASPVGALEVTSQDRVGAPGAFLPGTRVQSGPAFGDGLVRSFAGHEFAAFDALGAPFWFDLGDFASPAHSASMNAQLHDFLSPQPALPALHLQDPGRAFPDSALRPGSARITLSSTGWPSAYSTRHFSRAQPVLSLSFSGAYGLSASAFTTESLPGQAPASGARLSWQPEGAPLGLHAGWLAERETLLGSRAEGAFGELGAEAVFFGIGAGAELAGWALGAQAEFARVQSASTRGLITGLSSLATSTFAVRARRALGRTGTLGLSVSQPLRIEAGRARLDMPVGRTRAGHILRRTVRAPLVPSGRQLDVAAHWSQPLGRGEWRLGGVWSHEPRHQKAAGPELTLLGGWLYTF